MFEKIGFIGLGLIGGSIAKAIRLNNLASTIIAYNRDQKTLELAYKENVIDEKSFFSR